MDGHDGRREPDARDAGSVESGPGEPDPRDSDAHGIEWGVAASALILVLAIAAWAIVVPDGFGNAPNAAFEWLVGKLGWSFIIAAVVFFIAMIALAFSSLGHIRLGRDGEKPEFSTGGWIAKMFAAGMGIGLLFYGGYEPLYH